MTSPVDPDAEGHRPPSRWHEATVALLAGLAVASAMFFLIAAVQTPGLDPPPESAALFVVATSAAVISYRLVAAGAAAGYVAAILTGGFVLAVVALVAAGVYGTFGPRTNPIGPAAYLALDLAVVATAWRAWRTRSGTGRSSRSGPVRSPSER